MGERNANVVAPIKASASCHEMAEKMLLQIENMALASKDLQTVLGLIERNSMFNDKYDTSAL